jgi:hypothetical protein
MVLLKSAPGRYESEVTSIDPEKAVVNLLLDKEIDFKQIPSLGCSIKWKN